MGATSETIRLLVGAWRDEDDDEIVIGRTDDGGFSVAMFDSRDGELFEVRRVRWQRGHLSWEVRVPSTGVELRYQTTRIGTERLEVTWRNAVQDPDLIPAPLRLRGLRLRGQDTFLRCG